MNGFKVPNDVFRQGLKHAPLVVYLYLLSKNWNGSNVVTATYGQIAKKLEISPRTAFNAIESLIARNLISRDYKRVKGQMVCLQLTINIPESRGWVWVERRLFDLHLSARHLNVYLTLKSHSNYYKTTWPTLDEIAADTGLARKTVITTIKELVSFCLLHKHKKKDRYGRAAHNHYRVVCYEEREEVMKVMRKKKTRTRVRPHWYGQTKKDVKMLNLRIGYAIQHLLSRHPYALFFCAGRWCKNCNPSIDPLELRQYKRKNRPTLSKTYKPRG